MSNDLNILDSFNSNSDRFPTTNTITSQNSIHDEGIQYNESQITQQNGNQQCKSSNSCSIIRCENS